MSATLIRAIATLAWPVAVILFLLVFRKQLRSVVSNVSEVRLGGQEFRISRQLDGLEALVARTYAGGLRTSLVPARVEAAIRKDARKQPLAAISRLNSELQNSITILGLQTGWLEGIRAESGDMWRQLYAVHKASASDSPDALGAMFTYSEIQRDLLASSSPSSGLALRAMELGLNLISEVEAIDRPVTKIVDTIEDVYFDEALTNLQPGVHAIVFQQLLSNGDDGPVVALPAPRIKEYRPDMIVSWETEPTESMSQSYFVDPRTRKTVGGWGSNPSGGFQFVGREFAPLNPAGYGFRSGANRTVK